MLAFLFRILSFLLWLQVPHSLFPGQEAFPGSSSVLASQTPCFSPSCSHPLLGSKSYSLLPIPQPKDHRPTFLPSPQPKTPGEKKYSPFSLLILPSLRLQSHNQCAL